MLFRHCLFFIAITLLTFSVAIPIPSGRRSGESSRAAGRGSPGNKKDWVPLTWPPGLNRDQRRRKARYYIDSDAKETEGPNYPSMRLQRTEHLPGPHDEFHFEMWNGTEVRRALMNAFTPLTFDYIYPKDYSNFPYRKTHRDSSLHGKRPFPDFGKTKGWEEFPLVHGKDGWTGDRADAGPARVIYSRLEVKGGHDVFRGVVVHGEGDHDHYLADHIKKQG